MMASITLCSKSARLDLIGLLVAICLSWGGMTAAHAEIPVAEISQMRVERDGDAVLLSTTVKFDLPSAVEDALLKGVAVIFVAEVEVIRERWYWMNKKVLLAERHMRLAYQPLTRRWRLSVSSGVLTNAGLGVALNQNFDVLSDALAAVKRLSRWRVADISELEIDPRPVVEFRFRLDISQLPRPLQIGTIGQSDWDISVSSRRPLIFETNK